MCVLQSALDALSLGLGITHIAGREANLLMGQTLWAEICPYSKAPVSMKAALRRHFGEIAFTRGSVDR